MKVLSTDELVRLNDRAVERGATARLPAELLPRLDSEGIHAVSAAFQREGDQRLVVLLCCVTGSQRPVGGALEVTESDYQALRDHAEVAPRPNQPKEKNNVV